MFKNFLRRKTRSWIRKARSARELPALDSEAGKLFRCQHCGFVCDITRDALGGSSSGHGLVQESFLDTTYDSPTGNGFAVLRSVEKNFLSAFLLTAIPQVSENWRSRVIKGCPFCGSLNWKGEF